MKNLLSVFAGQHPECCQIIEDDSEIGCMEFDVQKGRITFRLTEPCSEARRKQASVAAKKHLIVQTRIRNIVPGRMDYFHSARYKNMISIYFSNSFLFEISFR